MKRKISVLIVAAIVLILYSAFVFLVPFQRNALFWLSYAFTMIAILSQLVFVFMAFFRDGSTARSRFYGYPIFRVGMIYMGIQVIVSLIFMFLGSLGPLHIPLWLPTLCYLIILGLGAIGLIAVENVRDSVQEMESKQGDQTVFIRNLRRAANLLAAKFPEFEGVAEDLRYADPVSTSASRYYEQELGELMNQAQVCEDPAVRKQLAVQMREALTQRNLVCKSAKSR